MNDLITQVKVTLKNGQIYTYYPPKDVVSIDKLYLFVRDMLEQDGMGFMWSGVEILINRY